MLSHFDIFVADIFNIIVIMIVLHTILMVNFIAFGNIVDVILIGFVFRVNQSSCNVMCRILNYLISV